MCIRDSCGINAEYMGILRLKILKNNRKQRIEERKPQKTDSIGSQHLNLSMKSTFLTGTSLTLLLICLFSIASTVVVSNNLRRIEKANKTSYSPLFYPEPIDEGICRTYINKITNIIIDLVMNPHTQTETEMAYFSILSNFIIGVPGCIKVTEQILNRYTREANVSQSCEGAFVDVFNGTASIISDLELYDVKFLPFYSIEIYSAFRHLFHHCNNVTNVDVEDTVKRLLEITKIFPKSQKCEKDLHDYLVDGVDVLFNIKDLSKAIPRAQHLIEYAPYLYDTCVYWAPSNEEVKTQFKAIAAVVGQIYGDLEEIFAPIPHFIPTHHIDEAPCKNHTLETYNDIVKLTKEAHNLTDYVIGGLDTAKVFRNAIFICRDLYDEVTLKYIEETNLTKSCASAYLDLAQGSFYVYTHWLTRNYSLIPSFIISASTEYLLRNCGVETMRNPFRIIDQILADIADEGQCAGQVSKLFLDFKDIIVHYKEFDYIIEQIAKIYPDAQDLSLIHI
eukprot:TRINITY_DN1891_c0_g2_i1.p1 TRINITY_DN1891_c0_g2~~TRINITY_DN1891_c0_g2_i1.p1  ORF type:complete len:505 (-),score=115.88 TRINITY_DN1891_c0_g2_i1:61-1575(-)